ncbi:LUD domain-containing protein [Mucilaginibacter robiniae]|uniref:LUD domain-containing protein n=1 Tax=Mucilaginibacter robiniae TaxID=2728022 RepID=A0A7L5DVY7_9SPHI|nr:LUD domain-containing protein [Mucilaginibacter robiniae]QJD95252.1 LUD domain-containing protein [Mucilaginibacter robiniae]
MSSRDKILAAVAANQPELMPLPDINFFKGDTEQVAEKYITVLTAIGGQAHRVNSWDEIKTLIQTGYDASQKRIISLVPELQEVASHAYEINPAAHHLADVELAVIQAHFAVAENGAVWVTEDLMGHRGLPFICQHLAAVININNIVPTMHEAYARIADGQYGFGTFIAGPSKTADIEQSLVLGAHGPRSMTVFLLNA